MRQLPARPCRPVHTWWQGFAAGEAAPPAVSAACLTPSCLLPPCWSRRSINFGGGGIFGACKNIDISEINGFVTLRGEPGGMAPDGTVTRPARLIMQFEGPQAHRCGCRAGWERGKWGQGGGWPVRSRGVGRTGTYLVYYWRSLAGRLPLIDSGATVCCCRPQAQGAALRAQLSRKSSHLATSSSFRTGGSAAAAASTPPSPSPLRPAPSGSASKQQEDGSLPTSRSAASGGSSRPPMLPPQRPAAVLPPKPPLQDRVGTLRGGAGSLETRSIPDSAVSMDSAGSAELLEQAAAAANSRSQSRSQLGAATQEQHQVPSPGKEQKGKNAALRFLSRLGKKKDKYQSKERGGLLQVGGGHGCRQCFVMLQLCR